MKTEIQEALEEAVRARLQVPPHGAGSQWMSLGSYTVRDNPRASVQQIQRPVSKGALRTLPKSGLSSFSTRNGGRIMPVTEKPGAHVAPSLRLAAMRAVTWAMGELGLKRQPLVRWFYPSVKHPELMGLSSRHGWEIWLRDTGSTAADADANSMIAVAAGHEAWHLAHPGSVSNEASERAATAFGLSYLRKSR